MDSDSYLADLRLRFRSSEQNSPTAEVITYLKSLDKDDMQTRINAILVMAFLPYARFYSGKYTFEQLRFACWEVQDAFDKHCSNMRLTLNVEQPKFSQNLPSPNSLISDNSVNLEPESEANEIKQEGESVSVESSTNDINNKFSYEDLNSIFGD